MILKANEISKSYKGKKVVNKVSVKVSQGEIVGLLGPNGAGKTTSFYMIVGIIKPEEGEIYLDNEKILLMHGDTLCADDTKYQNWRKFITNSLIKWVYSVMPLRLRQYIARGVRDYTAEAVKSKSPEIIDVSQNSVVEVISKGNVKTLIHGHTHRQGIHKLTINGSSAKRIVLGDWYEQDSILIYDKKDFRFERVEDYIAGN